LIQHTHAHVHMHTCAHTHTHNHLRLYGFCPGQPGWAGTRKTFTNSHLSWSSNIPYRLLPSNL